MVRQNTNTKATRKSRVKVGKLQLRKETIKDLAPAKQKQVKGGWPTGTGGIDGQCTARNTSCI